MKLLKFITEKKKGLFEIAPIIDSKYFQNLPDGKYNVEIKKYYKKRTKAQNRWYWFILKILGDEWGYTPEELHMAYKEKFLSVYDEKLGLKIIRSTTSLTTIETNQYWEKIYQDAAEKSVYIPDPKSDPNSY